VSECQGLGRNSTERAILERAAQNSQPFEVKTSIQDIPPKILEKLHPWEIKFLEIVENAEKSDKIGVNLNGESKN